MPLQIHEVKSYDEHQNLVNSLVDKEVFCYYVGAKVSATGHSWCNDCKESEPIVREYLNNLKVKNNHDCHMIITELEKDYFINQQCDFRVDPKINLKKIPTLKHMKNGKTLTENECMDKAKLDALFENIKS